MPAIARMAHSYRRRPLQPATPERRITRTALCALRPQPLCPAAPAGTPGNRRASAKHVRQITEANPEIVLPIQHPQALPLEL